MFSGDVVRKIAVLAVLGLAWEGYARWLGNPLLFPTFSDTVAALISSIASGQLLSAVAFTVTLLLKGYVAGVVLAGLLTAFASTTRIGADFLEILTSMFNPLPSIALLPIALIWFGLGDNSVIFVLIHAVLWSVALNTYTGFRGVSSTLRMVGQNYGLSTVGYYADFGSSRVSKHSYRT
jgi:sulfonate transport system permease protein